MKLYIPLLEKTAISTKLCDIVGRVFIAVALLLPIPLLFKTLLMAKAVETASIW